MREFRIYTCGKMSGLSMEEQMGWRYKIQNALRFRTDRKIVFIHPPQYYSYYENYHKNEREIMEWEMQQICNCDIVIVNLDDIETSIGSHMELGAIYAAKMMGRNIMVVAIGEKSDNLHPWIENSWLRHETDIVDAADFITKYLLI